MRADGVALFGVQPRVRRKLLEAQRDSRLFLVELENLDLDVVAHVDQILGVRQAPPGHIGDVQQAIQTTEVDERAVLGQVLYRAGEDRAFFKVRQGFRALGVDFFFQQLLARDDDVAALFVQLDNGHVEGLALERIQIVNRTNVNLRTGQKGTGAVDIHSYSALDAVDDDARNRLLLVVSLLNVIPRVQPLGLLVGEANGAIGADAAIHHDRDFVAGLELDRAGVVLHLGDRYHAFGLGAEIDHDMGRGDLDHGALNEAVRGVFFWLGSSRVLVVFEGGGEVFGGSFFVRRKFNVRPVRGFLLGFSGSGSNWFSPLGFRLRNFRVRSFGFRVGGLGWSLGCGEGGSGFVGLAGFVVEQGHESLG